MLKLAFSLMVVATVACTEAGTVKTEPLNLTAGAMQAMSSAMERARVLDGAYPATLEQDFVDEWGTSLRVDIRGEQSADVRSAGPDKVFDTDDDIVRPVKAVVVD